jgi:hypothetical protein
VQWHRRRLRRRYRRDCAHLDSRRGRRWIRRCSGHRHGLWRPELRLYSPHRRPADCNDKVSAVNPGADKICNGTDDNCNDRIDENLLVWAVDDDGDDYGNANVTVLSCGRPSSAYVRDQTDCTDGGALVYRGAVERCNDSDDSCDAVVESPDIPPSTPMMMATAMVTPTPPLSGVPRRVVMSPRCRSTVRTRTPPSIVTPLRCVTAWTTTATVRLSSPSMYPKTTGVSIGLDLEPDALACPVRPPPS